MRSDPGSQAADSRSKTGSLSEMPGPGHCGPLLLSKDHHMTDQPAFQSAATTLPPQSANGTSPQLPPAAPAAKPRRMRTRISGMRTSLIAGFAVLIVVLIFIFQNAHAVNISFLGAQLRLSLAVALFLAAIAGALTMVAAGTARITQLRRVMLRDRRKPRAS
jgi:uncharacterized integral membrane protein